MNKALILIFCFSMACCSSSKLPADEVTNQLLGRWIMQSVIMDGATNVTDEHNPNKNRYIIFNADHTFESGGDPHGRNTGRWSMEMPAKMLHLDSDAGEDDDSYWILSIDADQMNWQGAQFEFNKRFAIIHKRATP